MKKSGSIWHTLFSSFGQYEEGNLTDVSKSLLWNLVFKSVRLKLQLQELINSERCFLPRTCFFTDLVNRFIQKEAHLSLTLNRSDPFVSMRRYCVNLKAIRHESTSLKRIVADKSHRVIVA